MAVDMFLKVDGIDGESKDSKHAGEIDIESFSWGATQQGAQATGGGGGAGKITMQDFHFTKKIDKSSPKLMLACANGQHIPKVVLTVRKAGKDQQEFLKVTFTDVLVSSYQTGGSNNGSEIPTDQISLNFAKIEKEYKEQQKDGTLGAAVKTGYDLKTMKAV
jgi:type VI secretion system secreted protein Hcp